MAAALVTALTLVMAGCSGGSGAAKGPSVAAAKVSLSVLQYRSDQAVRRIQIKVHNDGTAPITVAGAALTASGFYGSTAWTSTGGPDDAIIAPGEATDLPVPLPTRDKCPDALSGEPRTVTATVRLELRGASGATATTHQLPATDPYGALTTVHDQDCLEQQVAQVAKIELVDPLRTRGKRTFLDLRLTPTGRPGTVTLESVRSTTLLDPPDGDAWKLNKVVGVTAGSRISPSSGVVTASLELQPARCDPHAIAEDKLGTVMELTMHVNDGASGRVDFPANTKLKSEIQNWVLKTCGF